MQYAFVTRIRVARVSLYDVHAGACGSCCATIAGSLYIHRSGEGVQ
jgi:hypothetical protein